MRLSVASLLSTTALALFSINLSIEHKQLKQDLKTNYISKSQCIPLPSSNVNDYWACKKEAKK
jgi:hypothetical protein